MSTESFVLKVRSSFVLILFTLYELPSRYTRQIYSTPLNHITSGPKFKVETLKNRHTETCPVDDKNSETKE